MIRFLNLKTLLALAASCLLTASLSANLLSDDFVAGDGTGITYTTGTPHGKVGGVGWAPGSSWTVNGAHININVNAGNYVEFVQGSTGTTRTRQMRREYADPGLSAFEIHTRIELFDLTGIADLLDSSKSPTSSGGSMAAEYFAIFDRGDSSGGVATNVPWYIEAAAGFWHVLPGAPGESDYGTPIAVAPVVEGETYDIRLLFPGNNTWGVEIDMIDAGQTYTAYNLPFIGGNTEENFNNFIQYRARYAGDTEHVNEWFDIRLHNVAIVPEPSTYALIFASIAFLGVVVARRRR